MYRFFRCLCINSTNTMIGHLERAIEANTHNSEDSEDTDGITTPYDVTDPKNITYLKNVMDLMKKITPAMKNTWKVSATAENVRDEIRKAKDKADILRNPSKKTYNSGTWTTLEKKNFKKGLSEEGYGDWLLISHNHVKTRSNKQCKDFAKGRFGNEKGFTAWNNMEELPLPFKSGTKFISKS